MKLKAQNHSSSKFSNGLESQWEATSPLLHYQQIQRLYFNPLNKMEKMHIKEFLHASLSFDNNLLVSFCPISNSTKTLNTWLSNIWYPYWPTPIHKLSVIHRTDSQLEKTI
jgi:hypothetical protein